MNHAIQPRLGPEERRAEAEVARGGEAEERQALHEASQQTGKRGVVGLLTVADDSGPLEPLGEIRDEEELQAAEERHAGDAAERIVAAQEGAAEQHVDHEAEVDRKVERLPAER